MNKKQALRLVIFILIFFAVLPPLTYAMRTNGQIKDIFTGFYAEKKDTIDVILIGSSPVYPFYSCPEIYADTGISAYPLSSNVQRPAAALPLVKEALKTQSPKLFVFEMRMYTMEEGRMTENAAYTRGVTDNLKYSANRVELINRLVPMTDESGDRYTYWFDIFKYHSNWRSLRLADQWKCIFYEKEHPLKGFELISDVCPLKDEDIPSVNTEETVPIPAKHEETLRELLEYLKSNDLNALFIVSPYREKEEEAAMINYMRPIITSYGYAFEDMNESYDEIGLDFKTDYQDYGGHVNINGAIKCTKYMEKLLSSYDLPDHRSSEGYASWDSAASLFAAEEAKAEDALNAHIANGEFVDIEPTW
ncbi:MAG: SGNH/GDSL hydrolase family protein [Lachnospiraceae bacterium]|nr:SGNH/GDSL hydrolase family protein [Lachnospiraceae bacterium]